MGLRRDAGLAAARLSLHVADQAREYAQTGQGHFVATTGILVLEPNAANVVPGRARMVLDIRAEADPLLERFVTELDAASRSIAAGANVVRVGFVLLSRTRPTPCDERLLAMLQRGAAVHGFSTRRLASGAGHDAAFLAQAAPSAMLFIPCLKGRSHAPEEWAEPASLAAGAATLLEATQYLDEESI
jgi:N-carbamoyl-L-amino-acid hydrolase